MAISGCGQSDVEEGNALHPSFEANDRPNIVLIVADDLGIEDVGSYGNEIVRTPNMDQLSSDGMRFTNAFVPASMCSPSRAALYTGLYPHRNGLSRNHYRANDDVESFPHYLTRLGYRAILTGKSHVKPFATFPFERLERDPSVVSNYIKDLDGAPFFMVVAQHHPHVPWLRNQEYDPQAIPIPEKLLDTPETREAMARYYSSITAADDELGEFLDILRDQSLDNNTVVIFMSDHGPQFPFAKFSNYDAGLHVPMIVRWPGTVDAGSTNSAMISSVDLLPTIVEIAGGKPPDGIDGASILAQLRGNETNRHDSVYATHSTLGLNIPDLEPYGIRSLRTSKYRFVRNLHPQNPPRSFISEPRPLRGSLTYLATYGVWVSPGLPTYWKSWLAMAEHEPAAAERIDQYMNRPPVELYDVSIDPSELNNLAQVPEYAVVVDQLNRELACWMKQQNDPELSLVADPATIQCGTE